MRIAVLMGGKSKEREVSLRSGQAVVDALRRKGYDAIPIDAADDITAQLALVEPEIAFIALHGRLGEDGAVQGLLEVLEIPYTGSGVACSAVCMDKVLTKKLFVASGIPSAPFMVIRSEDLRSEKIIEDIVGKLGLPVVIKPSTQGSSIGTTIVRDKSVLESALKEALELCSEALAEKFIPGTEVTASVLGNRDPVVLPLIEIESAKGVYDYEAKYTPGGSSHIIPARISQTATSRVEGIARQIYLDFNCLGFSRIDFIIDESDQPYVLEVNTIPGMTGLSLFPDAAAAAGIEYDDMVEKVVKLACEYWGVR